MTDVKEETSPAPAAPARMDTFATMNSDDTEGGRDRWPSRVGFYLAAIGSAVGFGNVWRFPALAKDYGGGAFFIPYLLALFLVGLPVLILEISLGQFHQAGNVGVMGSFHPRFRGVAVSSVACAFMLVTYYSMLLAWVCRAFFESWRDEAPWTDEGVDGDTAVGYFTGTIIGMETLGSDLRPTRIVGQNAGYAVLVWLCIWLCLAFGLKWTGRIAYITMGLPVVLLFIFIGRASTLTGSSDGIKAYIGEWDMAVLSERRDVWSTAVSQIFFSLSVTFGVMPAYGAACPRNEPAFANAVVVGISNSLFSIISGFAVFAAMGHLAYETGVSVDKVPYAGFSLVFGTWPVVFGSLPGGAHWVRLLFFDLFLLGIDSAFSILEAPVAVIMEHPSMKGVAKWKVTGGLCAVQYFLCLLIYATDAGLIFLDCIDFYINFVFLLLGFMETFGAGWICGLEKQVEKLGPVTVFLYMFAHFGSVVVACCIWFFAKTNEIWPGFVALFGIFFVFLGLTFVSLSKTIAASPDQWTWKSILYELCLKNVMDLKDELSEVVGYMPWLWAFMVKNFIPHVLLILFINLAQSENKDGKVIFGNYEGYGVFPYQLLGILVVVVALLVIVIGIATPIMFEPFDAPYREAQAAKAAEEPKKLEEDDAEAPAVEEDNVAAA